MTRGAYDDIINLPYKKSNLRQHMALIARAAQFSPFAALSGHSDAIKETARRTEEMIELDEDCRELINRYLRMIVEQRLDGQELTITYFRPDAKKSGGTYVHAVGVVKKVDLNQKLVVLNDGTHIPVHHIMRIEGDWFCDTGYEFEYSAPERQDDPLDDTHRKFVWD